MTDVNLKMLKDTDGNAFVPFSTTDAVFKDGTNQTVSDLLDEKQATLVSGTNIKTINNESLLGAGNITVSAEDEIAISTTEPTGNEILWINPNEVPSGIGSYISNTYGSSQEIGYSQEYVNTYKANKGELIWINSNPSSAFSGQTINNINLTDYKIIKIVFSRFIGNIQLTQDFIFDNSDLDCEIIYGDYDSGVVRNWNRSITLKTTSVVFGNCTINGTTTNTGLIPYKIIGYK